MARQQITFCRESQASNDLCSVHVRPAAAFNITADISVAAATFNVVSTVMPRISTPMTPAQKAFLNRAYEAAKRTEQP